MQYDEVPIKIHNKHLPKAKLIYNTLYGEAKTHREWAESFNIIGKINRILIYG